MTAQVFRFLPSDATIRPTGRRLFQALAISACTLAALLILVDWPGMSGSVTERPAGPVVRLLPPEIDEDADNPEPDIPAPPLLPIPAPRNVPSKPGNVADIDVPVTLDPTESVADWQSIARDVIDADVDSRYLQEGARLAMWRSNGSLMYAPDEPFVQASEAPVLANFRFKPEVHVAGLGMTIGSCFIGIPIVGVPVEQRTVAIRLFVCAGDSG